MRELVLVIWILTVCTISRAQGAPCSPDVELRRVVLEHGGQQGIWFQIDVARCLLADVSELRIQRQRLALIDDRLLLSDQTIAALREAISVEVRRSGAIETELVQAQRRIESQSHWSREPALLVILGGVLGFGLGVLATMAIVR